MPQLSDRFVAANQDYYNALQPAQAPAQAGGNSNATQQQHVAVAPSSSATKTTDGFCLSPWGNPSPNRSLLPSQFMYDFDTYRMYPSFFTFRRKWVSPNKS